MLEILVLIWFCKKISRMATEKGRASAGYVVLAIVMWFGGEIFGAIFGAVLTGGGIGTYVIALIGAALGAVITNAIVSSLSPVAPLATGSLGLSGTPLPPPSARPPEPPVTV